MSTGTAAEHAERAARRFETARGMTERSFQLAVAGFGVLALVGVISDYTGDRLAAPWAVLALLAGSLFFALYLRLIRAGLAGTVPVRDLVASAALAAGLNAMALVNPSWIMVGPFWVSAAALCLPAVRQVAALSAGAAAVGATYAVAADNWHWQKWAATFALSVVLCAVIASLNLLQKWLWDLFHEAYAAREAQAVLAVAEERLRFARDLHDLLGHNLSLIAVKSELAMRMAGTDTERSVAEIADIRAAARDALREVRAAVRGYRVVELTAELSSVRAVLEAAGVRCTVDTPAAEPPPDIGGVLAWVVREGATNVLKHSDARHCRISLAVLDGSVVLEMANDGARPPGGEPGSGLTGLAERVAMLGGGLTAERTGQGHFLLRAAVPAPLRSAA